MNNSLALLAGMSLLGMIVVVIVGIAVSALVLSVAFRLVVGCMPSYTRALATVVLTWIATALVALVLGLVVPAALKGLAGIVVMFLIGSWVINYMLRTQTGLALGFGKACVIQLVYMVIGFVVAVVFGLVMAIIFGSAMVALH